MQLNTQDLKLITIFRLHGKNESSLEATKNLQSS
jgi:hypothetical protein